MGRGYGVREPCGLVARRRSVVQGPGPEAAVLLVDRPREARRAAAKTRGVAGCCARERGSGTERERGGSTERERGGGTERERGCGTERAAEVAWRGQWWWHGQGGGSGT